MRDTTSRQRRINRSIGEQALRLFDRAEADIRTRLKEGYIDRGQRDREVAAEADRLAYEVWQRSVGR